MKKKHNINMILRARNGHTANSFGSVIVFVWKSSWKLNNLKMENHAIQS